MGVAAGRTYFAVEQTSEKNVYSFATDIDGQVFEDYEGDVIWSDQPEKLSTDLDLNAVVADWQNRTKDITWPEDLGDSFMAVQHSVAPASSVDVALKQDVLLMEADDVRWSDAVGNYLCGFIYYAGMVQMSRTSEAKKRDTAFMHVPMLESEEELEMGVDIAVELVQSLVQTWRAQRGVS